MMSDVGRPACNCVRFMVIWAMAMTVPLLGVEVPARLRGKIRDHELPIGTVHILEIKSVRVRRRRFGGMCKVGSPGWGLSLPGKRVWTWRVPKTIRTPGSNRGYR
jgi:hypothetical protein